MKGYEYNSDLPVFLSRTREADRVLTRFLWLVSSLTRRQILELLMRECHASSDTSAGLSTNEIAQRLHLASPTVSEHLRFLMKEGLVCVHRNGSQVFYRVANDPRVDLFLRFVQDVEAYYNSTQSEGTGA